MPTGYTSSVADGTITTLREYAMGCARAFGACIMMRDDSPDTPIPDEFQPSDYHKKEHAKAVDALAHFRTLNDDDIRAMYDCEKKESEAYARERIKENRVQIDRYTDMRKKVALFDSPSPDHDGFKKFMLDQLETSINGDDMTEYYSRPFPSFKEWLAQKRDSLNRDVAWHLNEWAEEVERTNGRNKWLRELREALNAIAEEKTT